MQEVVSPQAAEEMLQEWIEATGAELDPDTQAILTRAIRAGKLDFDTELEVFTLHLKKPLTLENGESISSIQISEPTGQQLSDATKNTKSEFDQSMKIISYVSGNPLAVIYRLKMRDMSIAGAVISFFA